MPVESREHSWLALATSIALAVALSLGAALFTARSMIGNASPTAVLGLSSENLTLTLFAAAVIALFAIAPVLLMFFLLPPKAKWTTLLPAVLLPPLGAFAFVLFLAAGLG